MFKVHVENAELVLEDCRGGSNGWLRVAVGAPLPDAAPHAAAVVDIEAIAAVPDDRQDPNAIAIHAVYGVYSLLSGPHLAVIRDARVVGSGPNSEKIYCAHDLEVLPVNAAAHRAFERQASLRERQDERAYIKMLQNVLASRTFYFSYDYDLTLSCQRRAAHNTSANTQKLPMWQKAEEDFFWNKPVLGKFVELELHNWIVPVISGFVNVLKKCEIGGMRCDLLFFTRRSWKRVGTRFNVRGVDKDGNVANFAETEMVLVKPTRALCSYVQIRGSIPLYWDQVVTLKYMPRTRYAFSNSQSIVDWNDLAFRAHMDNIIQRYGHITVVNLIDKAGKGNTIRDQNQLGTAYGKYVKKYNNQSHGDAPGMPGATLASNGFPASSGKPRASTVSGPDDNQDDGDASSVANSASQLFAEPICYVWFDFHHECRKMQWGNLSKLMAIVKEQFAQYGWFECDGEGRVLKRQRGVFRVNCMDNLDRTNVVMSLFARRATLLALHLYKSDDPNAQNVLDSPHQAFETVFKNAWADNADYVSKMYAGTGALKTDFTRTGKRTIAGALQDGVNSVTRYYLNNFSDGLRQDAYDLLVGNYVPDRRDESPFTFQQQHSLAHFLGELSLVGLMIVSASVQMHPNTSVVTRVRDGALAYAAVLLVLGHAVLKKGALRVLGRRYVCKPAFCSSGYIRRKEA